MRHTVDSLCSGQGTEWNMQSPRTCRFRVYLSCARPCTHRVRVTRTEKLLVPVLLVVLLVALLVAQALQAQLLTLHWWQAETAL